MNDSILALVTTALAPTEEILRNAWEKGLNHEYDVFVAQLTADGMDAQKSFAYPHNIGGRREYLAQQKR